MKTILAVDDHATVRMLLDDVLSEQGYRVITANNGAEALIAARRERPDLILLDVMMPNMDGLEFLRIFRRESNAPIILLTARIEEADRVIGLELGADDYVVKPFSTRELVARIRAVLRRMAPAAPTGPEILRVADLMLDRRSHNVTADGRPVALTPSEFELLSVLMSFPGRVFSRELLLEQLQGNTYEGVERTIDVHIRNLRKKLEPNPTHPRYIETVFGVGYRCRPDDEE